MVNLLLISLDDATSISAISSILKRSSSFSCEFYMKYFLLYSGMTKSYPEQYADDINLPLRFCRNLLQKLVFHCRLCIVMKFPYKRHATVQMGQF